MKRVLTILILLLSVEVYAIGCDCDVLIYSPTTGPYQLPVNHLKSYELEEYSSYAAKNQNSCRNLCLEAYEKDMPTDRLNAILLSYGESLIEQQVLGYNCTGLTTMKFPVRVKARLGQLGLGNVVDIVQVVTHEEACF